MTRLDWLRISLLAGLGACGPPGLGGEGETQAETESGAGSEGETGEPVEACEAGCEGAVLIAEGLVRCGDGTINRMYAATYDPTIEAEACVGDEDIFNCTSDADCFWAPTGRCIRYGPEEIGGGETLTWCDCAFSCATDEDCIEDTQVCVPPAVIEGLEWPTCQPATCTQNEDCGECGECAMGSRYNGCVQVYAFGCRTELDECRTSDECSEEKGEGCFPSTYSDSFACLDPSCVPGRALRVDAAPRVAGPRWRADWIAATPRHEKLAPDAELAAFWARVAALEHASVASFARFGLQLLRLGAPPQLLRAGAAAARDEVRHARVAFGLASSYGRAPIGPGRLDLRGVELSGSWREIVTDLIEEACVGETLNVAEALEAASQAEQASLRAMHEARRRPATGRTSTQW